MSDDVIVRNTCLGTLKGRRLFVLIIKFVLVCFSFLKMLHHIYTLYLKSAVLQLCTTAASLIQGTFGDVLEIMFDNGIHTAKALVSISSREI